MDFSAIARGEHRKLVRFFTLLPGVLGGVVALIGAFGLVTWILGSDYLTVWIRGSLPMTPITGFCLVLSGVALSIAQHGSRAALWTSRLIVVVVALVSLAVVFLYAVDAPVTLDTAIFSRAGLSFASLEPRRMAINTAIALIFFCQGLVFLHGDRKTRGLKSQLFATLAMLIAFIALVGHVFDVRDFYSFQLLSGMALSTAVALTLLGFGLLFSQLDRGVPSLIIDDGAAGFVARRLLPGALCVPFVLTILRVFGQEHGLYGQRLGASLGSVANMACFLLLIAWSARVLRTTDQKRAELFQAEREARDAAERVREEAEEAMAQAVAARKEAESANGAKSDFLAVMSHELRTPLAAIMGYQELLADGITGPITEAQGQQLGRIKASARHLLTLIDEILTFTRLDAGRETLLIEPMDVQHAMRQAAEIVESLVVAKKLELKVVTPDPDVSIESDPTKVRQILVNLLSNAVKFTDTGSVTLEGRTLKSGVQLIVSDTGIGIQPDNLNRIFDPFWQVEQKATRRATGTGLGLTVCRRLANLMGGDITVASTLGEGTTFTVTLPMKAPHIAAAVPPRTAHLRVG
ncbi:MAG: sensor histidine kinase [Thermoanaerobaculia bacterium]